MLLGEVEADVVIVHEDGIWRGRSVSNGTHDQMAARLVMAGEGVIWISDLGQDPTWRSHPAVTGEGGLRFYAGAPIRLRSGYRLGALRAYDSHPHHYDKKLAECLADLAAIVADECDRLLSADVRRMQELFEQAPGFMAMGRGPEFIFEMANPAYLDLIGARDVVGRSAREVMPEAETQGFFDLFTKVYNSGRSHVGRAAPLLIDPGDGSASVQKFIDFVYQPIFDVDGHVSGVFCQGQDVTAQKLSTDELRASQAELNAALSATQAIVDHSLDVICTLDGDGQFIQVSLRAMDLWGRLPKELIGQPCVGLIHPEDRSATRAKMAEVRGGKPTSHFSNRCIHKSGAIVPIMWSAMWSGAHECFFIIGRDMRDRIAADEKLLQAQKMEAVGRLTGGIAHDFNNLLTIVIGASDALVGELENDSAGRALAQLALDAGERGAELVSRLMTFSRQQPLAPRVIDLVELLQSIDPLLRRTLGEQVDLHIPPIKEALNCLADRVQLESAILNLCLNGRDAMPKGGVLTVQITPTEITTPAQPGGDDLQSGLYVMVSVTDTGEGMSAEVMAHALEPFFTTKEVGKGSGLGLSMVYGFAKQSGGHVRIESVEGEGTKVEMLLPRIKRAGATAQKPLPIATVGGRAHILVVEDDDLVREHVVRQLSSLGYRITASADGRSALEVISQVSDIDLLFTDVVMARGMGGGELADRARLLYPNMRVLFTSGCTQAAVITDGRQNGQVGLLHKPYRLSELAHRIAESLALPSVNDPLRCKG